MTDLLSRRQTKLRFSGGNSQIDRSRYFPFALSPGVTRRRLVYWARGFGPAPMLGGPVAAFLIERDTDPTRLSPDNATMMIAVLCIDNQVE